MARYEIWIRRGFEAPEPYPLGWYFTEESAKLVLARLNHEAEICGGNNHYEIRPV